MAARPLGVWGIDLGQCALKAIRLEMQNGQVVATAFEYIEHPKILSQPDADPDELTREALSQFLSRNKIKGDLVAISVPGQSGLARFVKLPPVDEKKIADIVKFEAKQQIPFPLEEVVWDFQRLNKGDIVDGLALETEIGLFAMKRDMVNRAIKQFKDVGVEVHVVQMAPLGLCNFLAYDRLGKGTDNPDDEGASNECVVALEIGTDNSNLVITDGGRIIWQRPIPIGGNHFTRALTKEMKLTFAKAEHLKRNAAKSPELKKILSALKQVLNDFVGEVQRSLGYFTNTHRNAKIQYMVGLGNAFRLPGLQKFLQEKLQLEVRKLQKLERATGESVIAAPTFSENIMSFGVAYGIALQGAKQARLQTNLLPYEVRLERIVRGKKPWAVAAAAVLAFGMFLMAFAYGNEQSGLNDVQAKTRKDETKASQTRSADLKKKQEAEKERAAKTKETLRRIGGGLDERMNWQLLHQFVNMVTPQANGGHIADFAAVNNAHPKEKYWTNNQKAQEAYKKLEEKRFEADRKKPITPEKAADRDLFIKTHLIQMNITGVNAMYSEDLAPYFKRLLAEGDQLVGMSQEEKNRIDKLVNKNMDKETPKAGWVVEIVGYTYHPDGQKFIENTLLQNLREPDKLKDATISEDLKKQVADRVSFLHLYKFPTDKNPQAGAFTVINRSNLKDLLADEAPGNLAVGGMPMGQKPAGPGGPPAANRGSWAPIGERALEMYGGGGQMGPGQPIMQPGDVNKGAANPKAGKAVPRTEFVVLFVWDERIVTQLPGLGGPGATPVVAAPAAPPAQPAVPPAPKK